jgi:hypothetical protein
MRAYRWAGEWRELRLGVGGRKPYDRRSMEELIAVGDITDGIPADLPGERRRMRFLSTWNFPWKLKMTQQMGLEPTLHAREGPRTEKAKS